MDIYDPAEQQAKHKNKTEHTKRGTHNLVLTKPTINKKYLASGSVYPVKFDTSHGWI